MKYQKIDTVMHRLYPSVKLLYSIIISLLVVILKTPPELFMLTLATFCILLLAGPDFARLKALIYTIVIIVAGTSISQAFFYYFEPKTVVLTVINKNFPVVGPVTGGIYLYKEGIIYGTIQSLRILSITFMATAVVISTHPSQMIIAMNKAKIPKEISFIITTSIRFLPNVLEETKRVWTAIRLKGFKINNIPGTIKAFRYFLSPLIINSLRQARFVALAAEVRGYSFQKPVPGKKNNLLYFNTLELVVISFFVILLYVAVLPFKMGLGMVPFIQAFIYSIPFTCILLIGIRMVPRTGSATLIIFGNSLFGQIISRGINPLWWPYSLVEAVVIEVYFFITKDYLKSRHSFVIAGLLRGMAVYLYFYFIAAPFIWHKFYAPWYIAIQTFQGVLGSAVGALIAYKVSKSVEEAYKYGGL